MSCRHRSDLRQSAPSPTPAAGCAWEPELNAEHHGEVYSHTCKRGISCHQDILPHQCSRPCHEGCGGGIDAARKLKNQDKEYEQIRFQPPGNIIRDIRYVRRPLLSVQVCHINTSHYIPRSSRHAVRPYPQDHSQHRTQSLPGRADALLQNYPPNCPEATATERRRWLWIQTLPCL